MKIISVKKYNQEGHRKYREAVDRYEFGKGGFPFLPMYLFLLPDGKERKNGKVVIEGNSNKFFLTKKELNSFIN